jgi:hypothetical protein
MIPLRFEFANSWTHQRSPEAACNLFCIKSCNSSTTWDIACVDNSLSCHYRFCCNFSIYFCLNLKCTVHFSDINVSATSCAGSRPRTFVIMFTVITSWKHSNWNLKALASSLSPASNKLLPCRMMSQTWSRPCLIDILNAMYPCRYAVYFFHCWS